MFHTNQNPVKLPDCSHNHGCECRVIFKLNQELLELCLWNKDILSGCFLALQIVQWILLDPCRSYCILVDPWVLLDLSWSFRSLRLPSISFGSLLVPLGSFGFLWVPSGSFRFLRIPSSPSDLGTFRSLWIPLGSFGSLQVPSGPFRSLQFSSGLSGPFGSLRFGSIRFPKFL